MDIDWPLALELVVAFAVLSFVRYRYFKRRLRRIEQAKNKKGTQT